MIRRSCLLYLDDLKVNVDKYELGQQVWPPRKIPISFFKCGSSCSGLKLSITPICEKKVLGMIRRSCLLYLDDLKVNVDKYEIGQQVWPPRKIPISFFKCGISCSGLKLSIAPIVL